MPRAVELPRRIRSLAAPTLALLIAGMFWMAIQLMGDVDWGKGLQKACLLVVIGGTAAVLCSYVSANNAPSGGQDAPPAQGAVWFGAISLGLCALAYFIFADGSRATRIEAGAILIVVAMPFIGDLVGIRLRHLASDPTTLLRALCLAFLLARVGSFFRYWHSPDLEDIGRTTVDAIHALSTGRNPYAIPIDVHPDFPDFQGYKYLPVMMGLYFPMVTLLGDLGLRATNLVLDIATAGLIVCIGRRSTGTNAGLAGAALYLMLPIIGGDLYRHGVTDAAPVFLGLAGLALSVRSSSLSGLAVGLSISAKLFPGIVFALCCIPPRQRSRYALGILIGAIPSLVFFLVSPSEFIRNTVLFVASRPIDQTSWLYGASPDLAFSVRAFAIAGLALAFAYVVRIAPGTMKRCMVGILCTLATLLAGPDIHNNYMLWWIPLFCILLGVPVADGLAGGDSTGGSHGASNQRVAVCS